MRKAAYDMLYLCACAVNGACPDKERIAEMDFEKVYKMSSCHSLSAMTAFAISSAGADFPKEWSAEKEKALRKNILFDMERSKILRFMEENGIWYMPLKGIIIKDMYPKAGMRQMVDNDILFDISYQHALLDFMRASGYEATEFGKCQHDTYQKAPIFNFEMHTALFSRYDEKMRIYYENVKERLLPVEGKKYAFRFTDEDYYIYITAHEYKHYSKNGTGLRSLLDRYIYISKKKELDFAYIEAECAKMDIAEFERESRALCLRIFESTSLPALSEKEQSMLDDYLFSETFGTVEKFYIKRINRFASPDGSIDKKSKRRYMLDRIFPKAEFYKEYSPIAYKYKVLIPFVWVKRVFYTVFKRRDELKYEMEIVKKMR